MHYVLSAPMGKKNEFIRIRADDVLKDALARAAERDVRTEADEARYLLMRAQELIRRQLKRHHGTAYLYPSQTMQTPVDYSNWRKKVWAPACNAAKIKDAKWNDWRHTFASDLTMAGHSDRTVADLMGHRSTQMVKRYAHLSNRHLRHAIESLANPCPTAARPGSKKTR